MRFFILAAKIGKNYFDFLPDFQTLSLTSFKFDASKGLLSLSDQIQSFFKSISII